MSARLAFADSDAAADLLTFAGRAARLDDGLVHLRAAGGVLAMSCAALTSSGLMDTTPTVLGMRMLPIDPELECDLVVQASALVADGPDGVALPASATRTAWAGIAPPRSGWEMSGELPASVLAARAQHGMASVAHAVPDAAGEDVVRAVRGRIWGAPDEDLQGLPAGVAFAAFALGFIHGDEVAAVRRAGVWTRVSLQRGHVLVRQRPSARS
ncbi:hypothetical protein LK09_04085 [Microbacterium mangrovi]|uniref:Uncharacterized protein n=1 Tax=Microbacterium mangrovi TaxID=1348253 RepID=A0A0B2A946_9MICO|nr:hypothetical protein [Microbacterium mangrovi]KHK98233.1 hypothetical protein LK09_04085 [Microbacterium mangrovi]